MANGSTQTTSSIRRDRRLGVVIGAAAAGLIALLVAGGWWWLRPVDDDQPTVGAVDELDHDVSGPTDLDGDEAGGPVDGLIHDVSGLMDDLAVAAAGPSQRPEDAARDGVVAELADLPLGQRVEPLTAHNVPVVADTTEGLWLISRPREAPASECVLGDGEGRYGSDFICTWDYTEILLLDPDRESIVKAYPMPSMHVHELFVTDDALYCRRTGDGAYPDSIMCRIDRRTGEITVRVFPYSGPIEGQETDWYAEVGVPFDIIIGAEMASIGGSLELDGGELRAVKVSAGELIGTVTFDPTTLEVIGVEGDR